ncbi:MAG: alpha/beta fold hydrolase [Ignavibacteriales bacterium]|nr:alpha/beta fold hydrolase [Ignavibacteriales bacterium]
MKRLIIVGLILLLTTPTYTQEIDLTGIWTGKLALPNSMELTVVFNLSKDDVGKYLTTLDSPDQGANGIPTESSTITDDSILVKIPLIQVFFSGKIFYDEMKMNGKWNQGGMSLDLTLIKVEKLEGPNRPQEPEEPFPYNSEEVLFENEIDDVVLAGTLTYPMEGNRFPAVVLITGSGGQDRNEELLGHKPFFVISDYLTRNGIAVLRFDDRGIAQSTGDHSKATSKDFVKDVLAAVDFLKDRKEIDKTKIGLIGHSEGGMIAPMAAVQSKDIAFIVLMAGPGISGDSLLYLQGELIQRANGTSEEEIQKSIKLQKEIFAIIKNTNDDKKLDNDLREKFYTEYATMTEEEKSKLGDPEVYLNMQISTITSPWFKYFLKYEPVPVLEKVTCPVLAINGGNDLQVPPKENLSAIDSALKKGGNKNFEVKELAGLNHLFQTSTTGAISEYGKIEETISPIALKTMLDWIKKLTK